MESPGEAGLNTEYNFSSLIAEGGVGSPQKWISKETRGVPAVIKKILNNLIMNFGKVDQPRGGLAQ